jgi:hypothetical protein
LHYVSDDQPVYGFDPVGWDDATEPHRSIEEMASHYVQEMRRVKPAGPYVLGGYCAGAHVALEMAQQLLEEHQEVALVVVLDAGAPYAGPSWAITQTKNFSHFLNRVFYYAKNNAFWTVAFYKFRLGLLRLFSIPGSTFKKLYETHFLAVYHYRARPYAGRMAFFLSSQVADAVDRSRWQELAAGGYDMHVFQDSIHGVWVNDKKHLRALAEKLETCIAEATVEKSLIEK